MDVAFAARLSVTAVTTGSTFPICTADPLLNALDVTLAVMLPTVSGLEEKVTVRVVLEALVTVPTAPLLKVTKLSSGVELNPNPLITTVDAFAAKSVVLLVIMGLTVATLIGAPLLALLEVTTTVKSPAACGFVEKVTVSVVAVAAVTVPTAPLLKTTLVFAALVSKPNPLIVMVSALASKSLLLLVTTGTIVATCTAAPLSTPFTSTMAVKLPAVVGGVDNVILRDVAVAESTVPTAPLLNVTTLLPAVGSNPCPIIVMDVPLAAI